MNEKFVIRIEGKLSQNANVSDFNFLTDSLGVIVQKYEGTLFEPGSTTVSGLVSIGSANLDSGIPTDQEDKLEQLLQALFEDDGGPVFQGHFPGLDR